MRCEHALVSSASIALHLSESFRNKGCSVCLIHNVVLWVLLLVTFASSARQGYSCVYICSEASTGGCCTLGWSAVGMQVVTPHKDGVTRTQVTRTCETYPAACAAVCCVWSLQYCAVSYPTPCCGCRCPLCFQQESQHITYGTLRNREARKSIQVKHRLTLMMQDVRVARGPPGGQACSCETSFCNKQMMYVTGDLQTHNTVTSTISLTSVQPNCTLEYRTKQQHKSIFSSKTNSRDHDKQHKHFHRAKRADTTMI